MSEAQQIHVVGSGRWARVLCRVLLAQLPECSNLTMHSQRNADAVRAWLRAEGLDTRVGVAEGVLRFDKGRLGAVLIANAAANHEESASAALQAGYPTLVEKPMALSEAGARRLVSLARESGASLAVSNVFRFATYVERFASVGQRFSPSEVAIDWHDPCGEVRHGERKSYDKSLPIIADILPHIVSLLEVLLPSREIAFDRLSIHQGGMLVEATMTVGEVVCALSLGRNQPRRRRVIRMQTARNETLVLDFSCEPGRIICQGREETGDGDWSNRPRPLTRQIQTFLSRPADPRLSPLIALRACRLTDSVLPAYYSAQAKWVGDQLAAGAGPDEPGLVYAALERQTRLAV